MQLKHILFQWWYHFMDHILLTNNQLYLIWYTKKSSIKLMIRYLKYGIVRIINFDTLYVTSWNSNNKKKVTYGSLIYKTLYNTLLEMLLCSEISVRSFSHINPATNRRRMTIEEECQFAIGEIRYTFFLFLLEFRN
jgi:hypothetical protein